MTKDDIVISRKELEGMKREDKETHHDGVYVSEEQNGFNNAIDKILEM